jgi:predicted ribosome-associated RNA-binding protein Tma20
MYPEHKGQRKPTHTYTHTHTHIAGLIDQYPKLEEFLNSEEMKAASIKLAKCAGSLQILVFGSQPLFFSHTSGVYYPFLRLIHRYIHD